MTTYDWIDAYEKIYLTYHKRVEFIDIDSTLINCYTGQEDLDFYNTGLAPSDFVGFSFYIPNVD